MTNLIRCPFLLVILLGLVSFGARAAELPLPESWYHGNPEEYEAGLDADVSRTGEFSAFLKSKDQELETFGTILQSISSENFLGKRVRLASYLKTQNVEGWAGMWMRVDGRGDTSLSFDNMNDRPLEGTKDWARYEIVLDVPRESTGIVFGVLLDGKGTVWVDDFTIEEVGEEVPLTGGGRKEPVNLGFEGQGERDS